MRSAELDFDSASLLKQQSTDRYVTPLKTHYLYSEPASRYPLSLMLRA